MSQSIEDITVDETENWDSGNPVFFHLHINEFDDEYAKQGRIWAVDVEPGSDTYRRYFVVAKVVLFDCLLVTSPLSAEQPRAYLYGTAHVMKRGNRISLNDKDVS